MTLDKLGKEIKVGDIIAYGHALGRCAGLRVGKVLKIVTKTEPGYWSGPKEVTHITVRGIDDDWSSQKPRLCERNGTLCYPNRTLVLTDVPEAYRTLLAGV